MYLPYVYKVTNKITKHFYIGMRSANKVLAEQDLGYFYFTSNKTVKENFKQYDIEILAYFKDQESAFNFENYLIKENFNNPLILNKHYQNKFSAFSMAGAKRDDLSEINRLTKRKPKEERTYICAQCSKQFTRIEHAHHKLKDTPMCGYSCSNKFYPKANKGIPKRCAAAGWNKGIESPQSSINGKKGAAKMSKTCAGRKIAIREDGTRYWIYPDKS